MAIVDLLFNAGPDKAFDVIMSKNVDKNKIKEMLS